MSSYLPDNPGYPQHNNQYQQSYQGQPPHQQPEPTVQSTPQPPMSPQPRQTTRKPRRWPWIVAIIVALLIGYGAGAASKTTSDTTVVQPTTTQSSQQMAQTPVKPVPTDTPAPTPTPTQPPKWVTTHTFTGNGSMKTEKFTVADEWKMQWTCDPASSSLGQYNVIVDVNNADGTPLDPAAFNTICKSGVTSGSTQEHQGGNIYLDINTEGSFTITVQELK